MEPVSDTAHRASPIITCRVAGGRPEMLGGTGAEVFPYWSFTKTVLAICALRLVEAGRIELDSPLPGEAYSLRQLLNHSAGLPDYGALPAYHAAVAKDEEPWSRDALCAAAMAQGRPYPPGAGWRYSNVGYLLVREFVERAAGQSLAEHLRETIAAPLGLRSVRLATTRAEFAAVHWPAAARYHPGWVYHGCLIGTAPDAAMVLHALFTGALLRPETLAQMLEAVPLGGALEGRPWTQCGYGLGLMSGRFGPGARAIGHSGGGPFCVNAVYHFPDAPRPVTLASFAAGTDEGLPEFETAKNALV